MLLLQSLQLLGHKVLHLFDVHASAPLQEGEHGDGGLAVRDSATGILHPRVTLTSYCACRLRDFWLRKPNTLEKCSFRISLNTCGSTAAARAQPAAALETQTPGPTLPSNLHSTLATASLCPKTLAGSTAACVGASL